MLSVNPFLVIAHVIVKSPCYGVSCVMVLSVTPHYGISRCYGVSPYYHVSCVMVLSVNPFLVIVHVMV